MNEQDLLAAIRALLEQRKQGETLRVLSESGQGAGPREELERCLEPQLWRG